MKIAHHIKVTVFEYKDSEKIEKIESTLKSLFPFEIEKNLTKKIAAGLQDKDIQTYTVTLEKNTQINLFMKQFFASLSAEQKSLLDKQKESRLDNDLHFFIRLDKDKLLENIIEITESGNCFHIEISIASYPKKRETALNILKEFLQE